MDVFDLREWKNNGKTIIAAHRGRAGGNVPCNTLSAFSIALNQGAQIIELDVTRSLDGELFVFHPFMDFFHLGKIIPIQMRHSNFVKKSTYLNYDGAKTNYKVITLDEALAFLKGKCVVNIDKFWTHPKEISDLIRKYDMQKSVIIKSYLDEKSLNAVLKYAPDMPYMAIVRECNENIIENILSRGINLVAVELLFDDIGKNHASDQFIEYLRSKNILAWVNSIVYNKKDVISAHLTDDSAVSGEEDAVWGTLSKKFDIIQTDWVLELNNYLKQREN